MPSSLLHLTWPSPLHISASPVPLIFIRVARFCGLPRSLLRGVARPVILGVGWQLVRLAILQKVNIVERPELAGESSFCLKCMSPSAEKPMRLTAVCLSTSWKRSEAIWSAWTRPWVRNGVEDAWEGRTCIGTVEVKLAVVLHDGRWSVDGSAIRGSGWLPLPLALGILATTPA